METLLFWHTVRAHSIDGEVFLNVRSTVVRQEVQYAQTWLCIKAYSPVKFFVLSHLSNVVFVADMDSVCTTLATRAYELHENLRHDPQQRRTIIALAGPPGSGKSTVTAAVVQMLNEQASLPFAAVLPMDGFHLPRAALDALPNKTEAYARRGAPWTFDAQEVLKLVKALYQSKKDISRTIWAPSFDHFRKDPQPNDIAITSDISLLILEGNWLLFDEEPWRQISVLVDGTWFIDVAPGLARQRIARRHIGSGIEIGWCDAMRRAENNDLLNGEMVRTRLVKPAITVQSVEVPRVDF